MAGARPRNAQSGLPQARVQHLLQSVADASLCARSGPAGVLTHRGAGRSVTCPSVSPYMPNVKVFGADWCPMTMRTLEHLKNRGVEYDYINIEKDPHACEWVKEL